MAKLILMEISKEITDYLTSKGFSKKTNLGFGKVKFKHVSGAVVQLQHDLQWLHYDSSGNLKGAHAGFDKLKDYLK